MGFSKKSLFISTRFLPRGKRPSQVKKGALGLA